MTACVLLGTVEEAVRSLRGQKIWPLTAAGAAGVRGHPAVETQRAEVDTVTTLHPATEVWPAGDCSRSLLNVFEITVLMLAWKKRLIKSLLKKKFILWYVFLLP